MQIGLRQRLVNAALIGPEGTAALQHQRDPLERRALSGDMGLAQQRLTVGHHGPPVLTVRCFTVPRIVETIRPVLKACNVASLQFVCSTEDELAEASDRASLTLTAKGI